MNQFRNNGSVPHVLQHVEHLRWQVRIGHVKLCEICLQQWRRRFLHLQNGHFLLKAQDPEKQTVIIWASEYDQIMTLQKHTFWQYSASSASFWGGAWRKKRSPLTKRWTETPSSWSSSHKTRLCLFYENDTSGLPEPQVLREKKQANIYIHITHTHLHSEYIYI